MLSPFSNSGSVHTFTASIVSLKHHRSLEERISTLIKFCTNSLLGQIFFFLMGMGDSKGERYTTKFSCWKETGTRLVVLLWPWSVIYNSVLIKIFKTLPKVNLFSGWYKHHWKHIKSGEKLSVPFLLLKKACFSEVLHRRKTKSHY